MDDLKRTDVVAVLQDVIHQLRGITESLGLLALLIELGRTELPSPYVPPHADHTQ